ncbi:MAG TPA: hypothetical protein VMU57_08245 [Edaphobacter sp.]|uniref:hypothetical protein n=1 Tax=Edaphobacter sp. TaxID=1934404 RepID=UPI002C4E2037|nr:hypothetical protein [Edaphobacter sp.]HUZ94888.1 hypothetical protein [Edaphobacter sp.]
MPSFLSTADTLWSLNSTDPRLRGNQIPQCRVMRGTGVEPAGQLVGEHSETIGDDQVQLAAGPSGSVPGFFFAHQASETRINSVKRAVDFVRFLFAYSVSMADKNDRRRIYLFFQLRNGWQCQFLEPDLKTSLPRKPVLTHSETLIGLVERGGGLPDLASRQALDQAIAKGRGGVFLNLPQEQYERLRQRR